MIIQASDPVRFVSDPQVRTALTESIAALASVPLSYVVNVSFIQQPAGQAPNNVGITGGTRRLQGSSIQVHYTIAMPKMATVGAAAEGARIRDALGQAEPETVTSLIVNSMGMASYNLSVARMLQPELSFITVATKLPVASTTDRTGLDAGMDTLLPPTTVKSQGSEPNEMPDLDWTTVSLVTGGVVFVVLCAICLVVSLPRRRQQQAAVEEHFNSEAGNARILPCMEEGSLAGEVHDSLASCRQQQAATEEYFDNEAGNDRGLPCELIHEDVAEESLAGEVHDSLAMSVPRY